MQRPKWWEYNTAGEYLKAQYNYVRSFKDIKTKDFIVHMGAKNRSSLYAIFRGANQLDPRKMDRYKTIFNFTNEELEYLTIMTLRDKSVSNFEKEFWSKKADKLLAKKIKKNVFKQPKNDMSEMWNKFIKEEALV